MRFRIGKEQIVVVLVSRTRYESNVSDMVSSVSENIRNLCYVSMNKPHSTLGESFKKKGIDMKKILFIDCVTGKVGKESDYNVLGVSSPKALTELSIVIGDAMKKPLDVIVFDSLSTLLVYHDSATAVKFLHFMVSRIRTTKDKCIFICLMEDGKSDLMKDVSMFVDKIVKPAR